MVVDYHHCPRCGREPHSADFSRREPFSIYLCRACGEVFCESCADDDDRCPECGSDDVDDSHDYVSGL